MSDREPLETHEPDAPRDHAEPPARRDDVRAQRRRLIRNILLGAPAVIAASARSAHASNGYGYCSMPGGQETDEN